MAVEVIKMFREEKGAWESDKGPLAIERTPQLAWQPSSEKLEEKKGPLKRMGSAAINALMSTDSSLRKSETMRTEAHWFLDSKPFLAVVYSTIVLNSVQMGLAVDYWEEENVWDACEHGFTAIFLLEMTIKLYFLGQKYFADGWNKMDFFLVVMSILDNWFIKPLAGDDGSALSQLSILRVLRVLRVARMARLLKVFKELWIILKGILESLRVMFWVTLLLLLTLYVCSILCVDVLGRKEAGFNGFDDNQENIDGSDEIVEWNNFIYFGTMGRSMYTLYNIVILAEFPEHGRPIMERQPAMIFFFIVFTVFTTFGVLNVIIGVIVDNTMEAAKTVEEDIEHRERNEKLALLMRVRDMVFNLDTDDSGTISIEEVKAGWDEDELQALLQVADLPKGWTPSELMCLIDSDGDGELAFDEFMISFYRLIASNSFQMNCCTHASLNQVKRGLMGLERNLNEVKSKHNEDMADIKASLKNNHQIIMDRLDRIESTSKGESQRTCNRPGDTNSFGTPVTLPCIPCEFSQEQVP